MKPLHPPLIASAPELAVIDILNKTLHIAIFSLFDAHPPLAGPDPPPPWRPPPPSTLLADNLIFLACQLADRLAEYRRVVERELECEARPSDNVLF